VHFVLFVVKRKNITTKDSKGNTKSTKEEPVNYHPGEPIVISKP
jgi:hypothetical protein